MTTYSSDRFKVKIEEFIKAKPWFKGVAFDKAGTYSLPVKVNFSSQKEVEWDIMRALGADIEVSADGSYPEGVEVQTLPMVRKILWFNGKLDLTDAQYKDLKGGEIYAQEAYKRKLDNIQFAYDRKVERYFLGHGIDFTADKDYDKKWEPWFGLTAVADSSASHPAAMQTLVTNTAATTGTTGTILDMAAVLTSNLAVYVGAIDWARKVFQPVIRAFTAFEDSVNGQTMVQHGPGGIEGGAKYSVFMHPSAIDEINSVKIYDGEKLIAQTVGDAARAMGIEFIPSTLYSASLVEDGVVQFGMVANFSTNFQKAPIMKLSPEGFYEITAVNPKWIQRMPSRYMPYTEPYYNGTNWFKAYFAGSFVFLNDA